MPALGQTAYDRLAAPASLAEAHARAAERRRRFSIGLGREEAAEIAGRIVRDLGVQADLAEAGARKKTLWTAPQVVEVAIREAISGTQEATISEAAAICLDLPTWMRREGGAHVRSISDIVGAVSRARDVSSREILSACLRARVAKARMEAIYWSARLSGGSLKRMGRAFDRDHTSILYAICRYADSADLPQIYSAPSTMKKRMSGRRRAAA